MMLFDLIDNPDNISTEINTDDIFISTFLNETYPGMIPISSNFLP